MVGKTRQAQPRSRLRKGYHIDLSDLHAQCEANYHRLMRLFPAYEQESQCVFEAGEVSVVLEVTARGSHGASGLLGGGSHRLPNGAEERRAAL